MVFPGTQLLQDHSNNGVVDLRAALLVFLWPAKSLESDLSGNRTARRLDGRMTRRVFQDSFLCVSFFFGGLAWCLLFLFDLLSSKLSMKKSEDGGGGGGGGTERELGVSVYRVWMCASEHNRGLWGSQRVIGSHGRINIWALRTENMSGSGSCVEVLVLKKRLL